MYDRALIVGRVDSQLGAKLVERHDRLLGQMRAKPGILTGAGQPRHQHDLESCVVVGCVIKIVTPALKIEKTAMIARKCSRYIVTARLPAEIGRASCRERVYSEDGGVHL